MIFTGSDKALLDRAARMMDREAKRLAWDVLPPGAGRKTAKLEFDRLTRDARDLRALGKRHAPAAALRVKKEKPAPVPPSDSLDPHFNPAITA